MKLRLLGVLLAGSFMAGSALPASASTCPARPGSSGTTTLRVGIREFRFPGNSIEEVSRTTSFCIGCHDGIAAQGRHSSARAVPASRRGELSTVRRGAGDHPTDVPYPRMKEGFRPLTDLDPRLRLRDGLITCDTCHGGPATASSTLSIPNTRSALCLGCHLK